MKIIGESQENTIRKGQASGNSIFIIDSGVNLTIEDLTFGNERTVESLTMER